MSREIVTPYLVVCPEEPDGYDEYDGDVCYAVGNTSSNRVFASVVDAEKAMEIIDHNRHTMDDGSIVYPNLDDEDWDELFVEKHVDSVEPGELSCHPY